MTYRIDPRRKAAARWHALLNNGMHYAAVDGTAEFTLPATLSTRPR